MVLLQLTGLQQTEIVFKIIQSAATGIALLIGAIWAFYKFYRQRENYSLIDFTVDVEFHSQKDDWWIVELIAYIENKGKVQHRIQDFEFELASLNANDEVTIAEQFGSQVYFPNILSRGSFLQKKYKYFFNEPGLKNKYSFVARVPKDANTVLLHSWFKYLDGKHSHSAEVTKKVPIETISRNNA